MVEGPYSLPMRRLRARIGLWIGGAALVFLATFSLVRIAASQKIRHPLLIVDQDLRILSYPFGSLKSIGLDQRDRITHVGGRSVNDRDELEIALNRQDSWPIDLMIEPEGELRAPFRLVWSMRSHRPLLEIDDELRVVANQVIDLRQMGMTVGSLLEAVNGETLTSPGAYRSLISKYRSRRIRYTLGPAETEGPRQEVVSYQLDWNVSWVLWAVGLVFGGLGICAFSVRPDARMTWGFYIFCLAYAAFSLLRAIPTPYRTTLERELFDIILYAMIPAVFVFVGTFSPLRRAIPRLRPFMVGAVFYSIALWLLDRATSPGLFRFSRPALVVWSSTILLLLLLSLPFKIWCKLGSAVITTVDRQHAAVLRIGVAAAFLPMSLYTVVRATTGMGMEQQLYFELPVLFFPAIVTFAIVRYNLLRVGEILAESLLYGALLGATLLGSSLLFGALLPVVHETVGDSRILDSVAAGMLMLVMLASFLRLRRFLADRLKGAPKGTDEAAQEIGRAVREAHSLEAYCVHASRMIAKVAGPSRLRLRCLNPDSEGWLAPALIGSKARGPEGTNGDDLLLKLVTFRGGEISHEELLDGGEFASLREEGLKAMEVSQSLIVFPLHIGGQARGIMLVGEKPDLGNYSRTEVDVLRRLAREFCAGFAHCADRLNEPEEPSGRGVESESDPLSRLKEGIIVTDLFGTVVYMNASAERLTGWGRATALGIDATEVFKTIEIVGLRTKDQEQVVETKTTSESASSTVARIVELARQGDFLSDEDEDILDPALDNALGEYAMEAVLISKQGRERFIKSYGVPNRDENGNHMGTTLVFREVESEDKKQESQNRSA